MGAAYCDVEPGPLDGRPAHPVAIMRAARATVIQGAYNRMQAQRPAGVAARAGLITGLFVGILSLPVITLSRLTSGAGLGLLFLIVALVAFAIAGYIATRRSGLLRSGVGAGALAALIAIFIAICLGVVIVALLAPRVALVAQAPLGGRGFGGRGVPNPGVRSFPRVRAAIVSLFLAPLLLMGTGVLGGFLGALLARLGRPRQPVAPQFAPAGFAPQFTAPPAAPAAPFAPAAPNYPSNPGGATPPPYYPPTPPYDPNAPTNPSGPNGA